MDNLLQFFDAYLTGWKKALEINGRTTRQSFWLFIGQMILVYIVFIVAIFVVSGVAQQIKALSFVSAFLSAVYLLFSFAHIVPCFTIQIRRTRDATGNGWLWLLGLIPLLGSIALLVIYLSPTDGLMSLS